MKAVRLSDPDPSLAAARELVVKEKMERVMRFKARLESLVKEERVSLSIKVSLQGMTIVPGLDVTALD